MAAFGTPYVELAQAKTYILKEHAGKEDAGRDSMIQMALNAATSAIEGHCHRQFNRDEEASARTYKPCGGRLIITEDFWTTTDLAIQTGNATWGWGTNWDAAQYTLAPRNGIANGVPGWPYRRIKLDFYGPPLWHTDEIRVTAKWGWAAVPAPVKQACLILTAEFYKLADAPLGIAGFKDYAEKVYELPQVESLLCPYVVMKKLVG